MKIYNVGLIGFGFIGKVHAYSLQNMPLFYDQDDFGVRIKTVCTSNTVTAEKASARLGGINSTTSFRDITDDPEIDIVDICSPNGSHCEQLLAAMAAQKHIYCEKPLTQTLDDALKIEAALPAYRGISQMTFHNRFFPVTLRAKEIMESGAIGDILEFSCTYLHSGNADPSMPLKWKMAAGVIADLGSHVIDLIEHLTGPFAELCCSTYKPFKTRRDLSGGIVEVPSEDNMLLLARLKSGASGVIRASKIATGSEDGIAFEIYGTKGALRLESMDLHHLYYYDAACPEAELGGMRGWKIIDCGQRYGKPAGFPAPKAPIGWLRGHVHSMYSFVKAVHESKQASPDLQRGLHIQKLMEKARISAETKQWVKA